MSLKNVSTEIEPPFHPDERGGDGIGGGGVAGYEPFTTPASEVGSGPRSKQLIAAGPHPACRGGSRVRNQKAAAAKGRPRPACRGGAEVPTQHDLLFTNNRGRPDGRISVPLRQAG